MRSLRPLAGLGVQQLPHGGWGKDPRTRGLGAEPLLQAPPPMAPPSTGAEPLLQAPTQQGPAHSQGQQPLPHSPPLAGPAHSQGRNPSCKRGPRPTHLPSARRKPAAGLGAVAAGVEGGGALPSTDLWLPRGRKQGEGWSGTLGLSGTKLLHTEWVNTKVLMYRIDNYIFNTL